MRKVGEPRPGNALRRARIDAGMSLSHFARAVGVSVPCASRWETDVRRPHTSDIARIALLFGCPPIEVRSWFVDSPPLQTEALPHAKGLRLLRVRHDTSRAELASRLGVSASTVAHWECGRRAMPVSRLATLGQVFGLPRATLVDALLREPVGVAPRLVQMRRCAGLTQRDVGRRLGVTNALVCAWERGRSKPSWPQMRRLSRMFGRDLREIAAALAIEVPSGLHPSEWHSGNLHRLLHDVRVWRGDTRQQIAERVGVHGQTIARWERGLSAPASAHVSRLETALGLRPGSLPVPTPIRKVS